MRLGITSLNYARWFGEARLDASGRLPLYFPSQPERVPQADSLAWSIRRARSLGVRVLADPIQRWREPGYVEAMADLAASSGIAIEPWMAPNYMATGDEAKQVVDTMVGFMRRVCRPLGATILGTAQLPMVYHRWLESPSLDEQLERYAENLRPVARAAEADGITLALENHCDYWAAEFRRLKDMVGSPALRFRLDTGNQWLVMEDPVRAAEILAEDIVTVHLKDVRIVPFCAEGAKVIGAPLGHGHVDLRRILTILRERGVSPDTMPLVIETSWTPPNEDPVRWTEESVAWASQNLAEFLR
jgi:sugar phosphate isomerase/epimerase